jgi:hypothetical protein
MVAEIALGEGDQDFFCGTWALTRRDTGPAVRSTSFDLAYETGSGPATSIESAADQVGDIDFVLGQRGTLGQRNGDDEAGEGFSGGDGIDPREMKDDAAFVEPVGDEFGWRGVGAGAICGVLNPDRRAATTGGARRISQGNR